MRRPSLKLSVAFGALLASGAAGFMLTLLGFVLQNHGGLSVSGNMCGPTSNQLCWDPALQAGWPLPYVTDALTNSGAGFIDLDAVLGVEDIFNPLHFWLDVVLLGLSVFTLWVFIKLLEDILIEYSRRDSEKRGL